MISIIIPVYNSETHIKDLIEQVQQQSFTDWELILVDDGSTDASIIICKRVADNDSRIKVISQKNSGPSAARNKGLEIAKSNWITFIDADDNITPNYLRNLYKGTQEQVDLVISGLYNATSNGNIFRKKRFLDETLEVSHIGQNEFHRSIFSSKGPCCKLFRTSIINKNKLRFEEGIHASEDFMFVLRYSAHCRLIRTVSDIDYFYLYSPGSLVSRVWSFESELKLNTLFKSVIEEISTVYPDTVLSILEQYRCTLLYRAINSIYQIENRKERISKLKQLKKISFDYGVTFDKLYFEHNFRMKCLHWFYRNDLFAIYDFIKSLIK